MQTYHSFSSDETKNIGAAVAKQAVKTTRGAKQAYVIALRGDLGAGKTTFTQGFLRAFGVRGRVTSPTFVLMKKFPLQGASRNGRTSGSRHYTRHAYHIDAYRFRAASEADALGLKEIMQDPQAIVLVEWPERLKGVLPRVRTDIRFTHGKKENERIVKVSAPRNGA